MNIIICYGKEKKRRKNMKVKKIMAAVLAASLAALSLAGCSSDSETAATTAAAAASSDASASTGDGSAWASGSNVYFDVPAKAGGGTDLYTRYLTQALGEVCPGVNFVVNNYETSEVGMEHVKNADPDGLTLGTCHGGAIIQYLCGSSDVNIKDDCKVVGIMNLGGPQAIIANPDAPYSNFKELGEYIMENPGDLVVGCSLGGTTQVLFTALIEALTGDPDMVNFVQCSSEADKLTNVASNAINLANCSIPNAEAYEQDGKLTVLGTLGPTICTLDNMCELVGMDLDDKYETTVEQGVDVVWDSYYYVIAPKDTPDELCEAINAAIMAASDTDSYIEGNKQMATYVEPIDYQGSIEKLDEEWALQDELTASMGLKIR